MKKKWFKNLHTGDVYYREGYTKFGSMVLRDRDRQLLVVEKHSLKNYSPIEATGFPPDRPKAPVPAKPKFNARSQKYYEKVGFFVPSGRDKAEFIYYEYGRSPGGYCFAGYRAVDFVENLFNQGTLTTQPTKVRDAKPVEPVKPKAPVPATGQFGPGPWYGAGLKYVSHSAGFHVYKQKANTFDEMVGWVSYEVVQHLWDLNMVSKERPRVVEPAKPKLNTFKELKDIIDGSPKLQADLAKKATIRSKDVKPKKILVEWAVSLGAEGPYLYELYPDWKMLTLPGSFKTGRTVEVPQ